MAALAASRKRLLLLACYAVPAGLFVAINLSSQASDALAMAMSTLVESRLWPDPTDLVALASLPLSWRYLALKARGTPLAAERRAVMMRSVLAALAAMSCIATSKVQAPAPTHTPIYMSWETFRNSAIEVLPPQPIRHRGKLLLRDHYLLISEPGAGVHIFDNSDQRAPVGLMFIRIPGNIDIALRDDLLYADSFVDLLTLKIDFDRRTATLVDRLEDQFKYDPYQTVTTASEIYARNIDEKRGVVVGFTPIAPSSQQANDD